MGIIKLLLVLSFFDGDDDDDDDDLPFSPCQDPSIKRFIIIFVGLRGIISLLDDDVGSNRPMTALLSSYVIVGSCDEPAEEE